MGDIFVVYGNTRDVFVRNAQIRLFKIDTSDEKKKYMFTDIGFYAKIRLIGNVTDTDTDNGADNVFKNMEISNNKKGRKK